jgi:hypothetical protein
MRIDWMVHNWYEHTVHKYLDGNLQRLDPLVGGPREGKLGVELLNAADVVLLGKAEHLSDRTFLKVVQLLESRLDFVRGRDHHCRYANGQKRVLGSSDTRSRYSLGFLILRPSPDLTTEYNSQHDCPWTNKDCPGYKSHSILEALEYTPRSPIIGQCP